MTIAELARAAQDPVLAPAIIPYIAAPTSHGDMSQRLAECSEIERNGGSAEATRRDLILGFELSRINKQTEIGGQNG